MIPVVRPRLARLRSLSMLMFNLREPAKAAAAASASGGGMEGGSVYVEALVEIDVITAELSNAGIQLKDRARGLIDFPCFYDGRIVLLCWQLGEREEIEFWHETEAGFAGRQRLPEIFHS